MVTASGERHILEKVEINFAKIKDDLFASGNIYWKKKYGTDVLISAKSDILNFDMIQKLISSNQLVLIEESNDYLNQEKVIEIFKNYKKDILISKKLHWRTLFNSLLLKFYYNTEKSQFDLNLLFWKMFSTIPREQGAAYLDKDRDYFLRATSIATSYTLCAFLLGYYDEEFLTHAFNSIILNQMEIGKNELITDLKINLENLRRKPSLDSKDKEFVSSIIDQTNLSQSVLFEKYDGSGLLNINVFELTDLELILTSLNYYYHFSDQKYKNILSEIREEKFYINKRILNLLKRNFEIITNANLAEIA